MCDGFSYLWNRMISKSEKSIPHLFRFSLFIYRSSNAASLTKISSQRSTCVAHMLSFDVYSIREQTAPKREDRAHIGQTHVKTCTIGTFPEGISDSGGLVFSTPSVEAVAF